MAFDTADYSKIDLPPAEVKPLTKRAQETAQKKSLKRERLLALADFLEKVPDENFNILTWGRSNKKIGGKNLSIEEIHTCGTVACIAGYAALMMGCELRKDNRFYQGECRHTLPSRLAGDYLMLTPLQKEKVFFGIGYNESEPLTPRNAAFMLRHLAKTGRVKWEP